MKPYKSIPLLEWTPADEKEDTITSAIGTGTNLYFGTKCGTLVKATISDNLLPEKVSIRGHEKRWNSMSQNPVI